MTCVSFFTSEVETGAGSSAASSRSPRSRIESIGQAEGAKRKIIVIVRNRTGKPALLERTEEIIP